VSIGGGPDVEHDARSEPPGKGRVVVLSGPSAVGKSTVVRCLRERIPDLHFSVSATTRAPRPGEVDGVDYHFVSPARFQQLIDEGALLEWAEIHGGLHRSGTLAAPVRAATASGFPVLIEVDLAGAKAVKKAMPEAIAVFLAPPSWEDLEARLVGRGTETPGAIRRRLETARIEMAAREDFDQVVVNSRLESACAELVSLLVKTAPGRHDPAGQAKSQTPSNRD
jgi:guanylate kinase